MLSVATLVLQGHKCQLRCYSPYGPNHPSLLPETTQSEPNSPTK